MALLFVRQLGIGLVVGLVVGGRRRVGAARACAWPPPGLYPVATLAVAALAFGGADALHGSGFLAVYLAGLMLGTAGIPAQQTVTAFHQGLAWVAQVAMFVALGLLVFPSRLDDVAVRGTVLALVLVFVARPVAVAVATLADALHVARAGGALGAPACAAPCPWSSPPSRSSTGCRGARELFDVVFFAVLVSTLVQGTTFEPVARWLGATTDEPALPRPLAEAGTIRRLGAEVLEYPVGRGRRGRSARACATSGSRARRWSTSSCATARRSRRAARPSCAPAIASTSCCARSSRATCTRIVERWRNGPIGPPPRPPRLVRARRPIFTVAPLGQIALEGDATRPRAVAGTRGRRSAARAPRRARLPRRPGGRALRDGRPAGGGRRARAAVELGDAAAAPPAGRRLRARVAAERRRGAGRRPAEDVRCRSRPAPGHARSGSLRPPGRPRSAPPSARRGSSSGSRASASAPAAGWRASRKWALPRT